MGTRQKRRRLPNRFRQLADTVGGLSIPFKMPCYGWSIPAQTCRIGSKLRDVPGSTCGKCYALKGMYMFPSVRACLERRYDILISALSDPVKRQAFVDTFVSLLIGLQQTYFRWHDSGDLQSVEHLELLADIAERLPHVAFWLPTREYEIVKTYQKEYGDIPPNLTVRLSAHMIDGKVPSFNLTTSGVHTGNLPDGATQCPAYTNDGACGPCRMCWEPDVPHVSYPLH